MTAETHRHFSGKRLRELRESAKLSRLALAKALRFYVGPAAITCYETGQTVPSFDTVSLIAKTLKVEIEDLTDAES